VSDVFEQLRQAGACRAMFVEDPDSGLKAIIAIDDLTLGPAAGGIRTLAYSSTQAALEDAQRLAAAMTLKCAIAGLDAGGAKTVVMDGPGLVREAGFRRLGEVIDDLAGLYRCAGDLGTTARDLECVAAATSFVSIAGGQLGAAGARGLIQCMRACAGMKGLDGLRGLKIAVQGCGLIGSSVARLLAEEGAEVFVADLDAGRATALAAEIGAVAVAADRVLWLDVDIVSPCGAGGTVSRALLPGLKAWAVCGGANNQLADSAVAGMLAARGVFYVPDFLASAGAVIEGIGPAVMGADPDPLIERLGATALAVLERSAGTSTVAIAEQMARARIAAARRRQPIGIGEAG
jgi:leucine dehydrogenase